MRLRPPGRLLAQAWFGDIDGAESSLRIATGLLRRAPDIFGGQGVSAVIPASQAIGGVEAGKRFAAQNGILAWRGRAPGKLRTLQPQRP